MRNILISFTLLALLLTPTANAAETATLGQPLSNSLCAHDSPCMRPGLWQITTTSDLLLLAAHIPPDQMQNVKDLATEYGLEMPQIENGAAITQTCITQQMADQKTLPHFYNTEIGCSTKHASRNGNNYQVDFVCTSQDLKGNGTAAGTITNPEAFAGQTTFSGTAQGNPVNERADINGKWLNANCGAIKPL
jgi:hypothetical protein